MLNCNPETVSTDYDTSDRLYFEPLTLEDALNVIEAEQGSGNLKGVIVGLGGQTPLKLSGALPAGLVLGTSPESIDLAEDRERWNALCARLEIPQPAGGTATTLDAGPGHRRQDRVPGPDAAVVRARRAGHGDRLRRRVAPAGDGPARRLREPRQGGRPVRRAARAGRPVPRGRHRGRRRRDPRPHRRGDHRRRDGARRGGRGALGRLGLRPAALLPLVGHDRGDRGAHAGHRHRARGHRPDQRAVRGQGQPGVRDRGQPAGQPHRALRRQGHRGAAREGRGAGDGRRHPGRAARGGVALPALAGGLRRHQGGGAAVQPLPGRRHGARPRDAQHG